MEMVWLSWHIDWESGGLRHMVFVMENLKLWIFAHSGIVREWVDYWGGISVCFVHKEVEAMVY